MPSIKLVAEYTFEHLDTILRPKDQRWGTGTIQLTVDHEPETQEDFDEISKYLAKEVVKDCKQLVLNRVYLDPSLNIIDGEFVDE